MEYMDRCLRCNNCKANYYIEDENVSIEKCYICGESSFQSGEKLMEEYKMALPSFIRVVDQGKLKSSYYEELRRYKSLCNYVKESIKNKLSKNNIDFLDVTCRIKKLNSFLNKMKSKNYIFLSDITDFCGIRIICFNLSDIEKISQIIQDEFFIAESPADQFEINRPDQFSYRSTHFIVSLKKNSFSQKTPTKFNGIKFEIQVRTVLMHAWADISHELVYKNEKSASTKLKHDLNRLSATLDLVDEQFDILKKRKEKYLESYFIDDTTFNVELEINEKTLKVFLDFCFPNRPQSIRDNNRLSKYISTYNETTSWPKITFGNLLENIKKFKHTVDDDNTNQAITLDVIMWKSDFYDWIFVLIA